MDVVWRNVTNPDWWFTAIVASVFAGFAKDWLGVLISNLSSRWRALVQRRRKERDEYIDVVLGNPPYLTMYGVGVLVTVMVFFGVTTIYLLFPQYPLECVDPEVCGSLKKLAKTTLGPFTGGLAVGAGYVASSRMSMLRKMMDRYRELHKFPPRP